ncbi:MAG: 30S ribosomal protein S16 [Bacteroidales bacterium]|jgi:small subunit ribosomal protein S16|nr:30S ribosomal protein S16 [Bacteroidales bacterium]NLD64229.1 30S ribosomal protein S16 [Bacteroidales bacterium]
MSVKIRLARKGRKKQAYYHVVVADSRSPRDGRFIEKIGIYNPLTDPATIDINFEKALGWLQKGAQPTDTCRAILKYKGVMMKKHLLEGVRKGAFDEAEADRRFNEWLKGKEEKIEMKKSGLEKIGEELRKKRLEAEQVIKEARAAEYAKRAAALAAEAEAAAKAAAAAEAPEVAEVAEEAVTEVSEAAADVKETVEEVVAEAAEAVEEAAADVKETVEEVVTEATETVEEAAAGAAETVEEKVEEAAAEETAVKAEDEAPADEVKKETAEENEKTE